ncbi:hypothetical protein CALVIDRAFT_567120 [Calocera viscosa TUFC12733]|uniref:Uncharacterized protein n=1 Tax=Calocera viscosa (strain TUFC12733) TaxID=1330018 RepID=A0A167IP52_CALVF|nr:hypothetical protein CALVIDRAFT_567120 [Calocera viscosa TUFC12733]
MKRNRRVTDQRKADQRRKSGSQIEVHGNDHRRSPEIKRESTQEPTQEPKVAEIKREEQPAPHLEEQTMVGPSDEVVGQDFLQEELAAVMVALEQRFENGLKVDARLQRGWEESASGRSGHAERPVTFLDQVYALIDELRSSTKLEDVSETQLVAKRPLSAGRSQSGLSNGTGPDQLQGGCEDV